MKKISFLLITVFLFSAFQARAEAPCVNVYFDRSKEPSYWMGKTYANLLQNLLGHFPKYQQVVSPIELYKKGDIEKCHATIYIGSYFNNAIPSDFHQDFAATKKQAAWLGYSIWQLGESFEKIFGYKYSYLTSLNRERLDSTGRPSFFKNILYKGETFYKYGNWSKSDVSIFLAPFEQAALVPTEPQKSEILAQAQQNVTKEILPYALRSGNHFYVADVPFSFMHEADRYFVFADLLFDILGEKPRHNGKYALVRIEDVHPMMPLSELYKTTNVLKNEKVPIHISLIPMYFDPLHRGESGPEGDLVTMDRKVPFMQFIEEMKQSNAFFIWHGVTHQYHAQKNPHDGISGSDFEFFDAVNNRPIVEDSPSYIINKLEEGFYTLQKAGIAPSAWLTPHYQASPLDYIIFGNVFSWNVGRVIYYNHSYQGLPSDEENKSLLFETALTNGFSLRSNYFKNLEVIYESERWSGQMFPYEIYGDIHGQRLIPENLGNSQPFVNAHVVVPRSKEEIVADAKRNLVLRDVWASFFYHPFLLTTYEDGGRGEFPGDPAELEYILREIKKLGYTFISLEDFLNKNTINKRPVPVYKEKTP